MALPALKSNLIRILPAKASTQQVFRQSRAENESVNICITIGSSKYPVKNWSRSGIAFVCDNAGLDLKEDQVISEVLIKYEETELFRGSIEVKSVRKTGEGKREVGAQFLEQLFPVEGLLAAIKVRQAGAILDNNYQELREINPEMCKVILEFASALKQLEALCKDEEKKLAQLIYDERQQAEGYFLRELSKVVKEIFNGISRRIATIIDIEKIPEDSVYHRLFKEHVYPFFERGDLPRRAVEKPRGYAGDFEMMNAMYRDGFEGQDLLGKVLHNYIANEDSSESVVFRRPYFIGQYEKTLKRPGNVSVLSLASGPAVEVQTILEQWPQEKLDRMRMTLFDLDRIALEHAQTKIFDRLLSLKKRFEVEFVNASVKAFLTHSEEYTEMYDLIYSGGLFDYLQNDIAKVIVQNLYTLLKPGGRLVLGNFTADNTTKAICHLVTRWHLIHKTEREMRQWAEGLPKASVSFDYDPHKIQAFIVIVKTE